MKLVNPKVEYLPQVEGLEGVFKQIEIAGRTCYTEDTEVLTNSGWKLMKDLKVHDKVLTYNPHFNTLEYDDNNLIEKEVCDTLIEVDHPQIKFCVTGDHRVYQSIPSKRDYSFLTAKQIAGIDKIPNSHQSRFRIAKYFIGSKRSKIQSNLSNIKHSKLIKHGFKQSTLETVELPINEDSMCLIGAFIAEGHTYHGEKNKNGSYCQITQTENTELYANVIKSLDNLNIRYRIQNDVRKPYVKWIQFGTNQCWVELFDSLCGKLAKNKHLPEWFRDLPDTLLQILLKYMYLGDGSHNKHRNEKYLSISKRLLDEVQEAFILLGKNGSVSYDTQASQKCYFEESHRDSWVIDRNKHINITQLYKGKVYCTSTSTGIICIRVNGKTCWCGNCYKSEDKITEDSARKFVDKMIASKHNAMLAHGTVYLKIPIACRKLVENYIHNQFSRIECTENYAYITTNYRVIVENNLDLDLVYLCSPTEYHEQRFTFRITSDRAILNEAVRNNGIYRNAFAQESTRWIDYFKRKGIAVSIAFVKPYWYDEANWFKKIVLRSAYKSSELFYKLLRKLGCTPQQARVVLVLGLKSELVMTAMLSDWEDFLDKRLKGTTGAPHPDMKFIASEIDKKLQELYEIQSNN